MTVDVRWRHKTTIAVASCDDLVGALPTPIPVEERPDPDDVGSIPYGDDWLDLSSLFDTESHATRPTCPAFPREIGATRAGFDAILDWLGDLWGGELDAWADVPRSVVGVVAWSLAPWASLYSPGSKTFAEQTWSGAPWFPPNPFPKPSPKPSPITSPITSTAFRGGTFEPNAYSRALDDLFRDPARDFLRGDHPVAFVQGVACDVDRARDAASWFLVDLAHMSPVPTTAGVAVQVNALALLRLLAAVSILWRGDVDPILRRHLTGSDA